MMPPSLFRFGLHRIGPLAAAVCLWGSLYSHTSAQTLIDWTYARSHGFTDGSLTSTFEGSLGGVDVTYTASLTGGAVFSDEFGANSPEILNHASVSYGFTGGGPNDDYLDIFITNDDPGEGVANRFQFSDPVSNASVVIWDIDAAQPSGDNYVDELIITATLTNGAVVTPTSSSIANSSIVTQTADDTWRAIPYQSAGDQTSDGNLTVSFNYANIESIQIYYGNAPIINGSDTRSGPTDTHAIGISNFGMSGISTPDSQLVFDTSAISGPAKTGDVLNGTAESNGGSQTIRFGNVFRNDLAADTAVSIDVNSLGNEATTYSVNATGAASVSGADGSLGERGGADDTDTITGSLSGTALGDITGSLTLDNTDGSSPAESNGPTAPSRFGVYDDNDVITMNATVYAHSNGSFSGGSDQNSATVHFGNFTGAALPDQEIEIHNLPTDGNTTYTVDMRFDVGAPTGDSAQFDLGNLTSAGDISAGGSTAPVSLGFAPTALGDFSATVVLSPEDHNLTPLSLATSPAHNGSGANGNDNAGMILTVTGAALDSQVTFDTDTSDGAGPGGQRTNGSTTNLALGNYFRNVSASRTIGVNNTGNEDTTFGVSVGSGDALINGSISGIVNQAAAGRTPPVSIAQATTFGAGFDTSVTGAFSGSIELRNNDATTAISGLDQGNGTGAGYGAEDAMDTLVLSATVYEHSNSSFTGGAIDTNSLTIDFGVVAADSGVHSSGFSVYNLPGLDSNYTVSFESTGITGNLSYLFTNLTPIDALAAGDSNPGIASFDTAGLAPGLYSATITISGLDDDEYISTLNTLTGGADLPTGYDPGDLTIYLHGAVVPEPGTTTLLALSGLLWLFRRPRRDAAGRSGQINRVRSAT